jgi:hypothetical protein
VTGPELVEIGRPEGTRAGEEEHDREDHEGRAGEPPLGAGECAGL